MIGVWAHGSSMSVFDIYNEHTTETRPVMQWYCILQESAPSSIPWPSSFPPLVESFGGGPGVHVHSFQPLRVDGRMACRISRTLIPLAEYQ